MSARMWYFIGVRYITIHFLGWIKGKNVFDKQHLWCINIWNTLRRSGYCVKLLLWNIQKCQVSDKIFTCWCLYILYCLHLLVSWDSVNLWEMMICCFLVSVAARICHKTSAIIIKACFHNGVITANWFADMRFLSETIPCVNDIAVFWYGPFWHLFTNISRCFRTCVSTGHIFSRWSKQSRFPMEMIGLDWHVLGSSKLNHEPPSSMD